MQRPGITLVEALVALFVAALGMISLLTLFPLGMLQMGQALKDGRCTSAAAEADALLRWYWERHERNPSWTSPIMVALDRGRFPPQPGSTPPNTNPNWTSSRDPRPSFPVLIDPIGVETIWPVPSQQLAVASLANLPRETVWEPMFGATTGPSSWLPLLRQLPGDPRPQPLVLNNPSKPKILRFCMFQNDLEFAPEAGVPTLDPNNDPVERGGRYSWAWLVQRPNNTHRALVNVKVLVFDQRAPFFANTETERSFSVPLVPGNTAVVLNYGASPRPAIVRGRWILDATHYADPPINSQPLRHANFYRVLSVNDETPGMLYVELETPIRRSDGRTNPYLGELVVIGSLAEVFERPPIVTGD